MAPFVVYEGSKAQTLVVKGPGELKMSLKLKPELEVLDAKKAQTSLMEST